LHVLADLDRRKGGPPAACIGLAKLMARRGHRVRIVTTDRGIAPDERRRAAEIEIDALPGSWPAFFGTSWPLRRRLGEAIPQADVVHLHSLYLFHDWAAGGICRRLGKPYIVRPHGTLDPFIRRRHRWRKAVLEALFQDAVLRGAAGLHYTAPEEWELARPYARNPRGDIVPIGVDLESFEALPPRDALRRRYPAIGDRKVVLFLGRLSFKKGVDVVVEAFAAAARLRDDVFLVVAGPDDGVRGEAEALIARHGLAERCVFTGMVVDEAKREVLAGSDVFLLPSQSENFGISVIEAAACGIPVVISDRVNLWRDFHDGEAGLIAPPTVEAFAERLRFVLEHLQAARELGRRGAELVRRRYGWDALGDRYEAMYAMAARDGALPVLAHADAGNGGSAHGR
jgi:glycosyltransferase involved in cell wall biosynthesis